jgi:anti-sigma regulatory factor (Ser/Thr protein kinase)
LQVLPRPRTALPYQVTFVLRLFACIINFVKMGDGIDVSPESLLLRIELRSNPEMLCVVRGALGQLTEMLGFPEAECRATVLAVDEALTNIIRHAYCGQGGCPIELSCRRIQVRHDGARREALEIMVEDRGVEIDSANLCGRALEDVRPGGLGLHFIRECMDTVEFSRSNGKNQLRLLKFLHAHKIR